MNAMQQLLTEHMAIWTAADTEKKSGRGRASGNAGSVYGIKKLRELILELAVRGKLVPQDSNDEPASELLKRIQAEKCKLVAEGKIKKDKPLAPIGEDEKLFVLPDGWQWVRLSEIAEANTGYAFKSNEYANEGTFVLRVTNINPDSSINPDDSKFISTESANNEYKNFQLSEGDILLVMVGGSLGKIGVVNKACLPAVLNQNMWKLSYFGQLEKKYFIDGLRFINKNQIVITESTHGHLAQGEYLSKLFPLPPLAEQHRIVAKVNELMALCDQLEAQHSNAAEAHEKLVSHLLGTLTQSKSADDFNANWQRIAAHFDTLFTTETSIDELKQTLLQLAVMGKLVPQDLNDEPVSVLFERIKRSESERAKNKEIQKPKEVITESAPELLIPTSWTFKTLGEITFVTKLAGFEYTEYINLKDDGEVPVIRAQNVRPFLPALDNLKFIDLNTSKTLYRSALDRPSLLVTFIGAGIGDVCLFDQKKRWHLAPNVAKVEPFADTNLKYLNIFLNSPNGRSEIFKFMKSTAQPSLSMGTIREIWVPLPPLAEQHRIVTKVDELMALCDQLKSRISEANQQQLKLANVLVEQAAA